MPTTTPATPGSFIVIEGTDGAGKSTQFQHLAEALASVGHEVVAVKFPRYNEPSSYFVRKYLGGEYGSAEQVGPYTASLFYALDRFAASEQIRKALDAGKIVLADRYVGANMAHQGTKFGSAEERRGFFIWLDNLEFEMLRSPRPDATLVLRVPASVSQKLLNKTGKTRDIHEQSATHLQKSVEVYDDLTQLFPKDFMRIDCARGDEIMAIDDIRKLIWEKVAPLLPAPKSAGPKPIETLAERTQQNPDGAAPAAQDPKGEDPDGNPGNTASANDLNDASLVRKNPNGSFSITPAGKDFLQTAVTNTASNVYAFTNNLSTTTVAAAMARLSRRGDDMRVTILDEFARAADKDQKLLRRVITAYGDDSVQQLAGIHVVVEKASNILTKKLEWGRLASYLEQSTRYIYFDQKDEDGNYKYFTPAHFDKTLAMQYRAHMDAIFDAYSDVVHRLSEHIAANASTPAAERDAAWKSAVRAQACDAARPMLPTATTSTVGIFASGQALESLIMHLLSDELPEAKVVGQQLLDEARKVIPTFLERADKPERGGAAIAYRANTRKSMQHLAEVYLPEAHADSRVEPVQLTDVWPRNELNLVADMLYEHSSLPLEKLRQVVAAWPYDQKVSVLDAYVGERLNRRHRPGRALEKAHYSWDLVCDYGVFRDLQRHRMVDDLEWQQLTPRYGYEIPKLVEDAGLSDAFESAFDISLKLYSLLQQHGYALEAQYATLLGHRMRWKVTYNAREAFHLHEIRTSPQAHPGARRLMLAMHQKVSEVHPLLAEAMKFVNQGEDPELSRLAAERYTQFKLQQLG